MPINKTLYLEVTDYSVSKETFQLLYDAEVEMLCTSPQPSAEQLPSYYESADYISHTDGKRSLFEKAYQAVKNIALNQKVKLINGLQAGKGTLLDIGAGTGDFLARAKQDGWITSGIEPNTKAQQTAEKKGVSFVDDSAQLEDHSFDVITMWHVLEHVPDVEKQFEELVRLIKPTGVILIAVPNFKSFDAKHYGKFWAAFDVPRHLWHFSKKSIDVLSTRHGLKLAKVLPMKFDAFYVSLLSERYKYGKMRYASALTTGLRSNWFGARTGEYSSHIYVLKAAKL